MQLAHFAFNQQGINPATYAEPHDGLKPGQHEADPKNRNNPVGHA
jgi:hypothetical protein